MEMTIQELKEKKVDLQREILSLINEFSVDTGFYVVNLKPTIMPSQRVGKPTQLITEISTTIVDENGNPVLS